VEMQKSRLLGTKVHITPAHRRVTGKSVRELSQLYEATSSSTKLPNSGTPIGTRSVSSRIPHSVSTKSARNTKVGAQANSLSKKIDTDKRKTPVHSRSFSQPAQPLSKPAQDGADSTHRKQRVKSEILRAPLQGILKRRPNGAVNATNSGICTSTQTECENLNSNNNYHQKYSLSLPSRRMRGSRVPIVRFSEGQNSSCPYQAPSVYGHCDKKTPAEWENFALSCPTRIMQATSWSPHKMRGWKTVVKSTSHKSLLLYHHNINLYHQQILIYWVASCIASLNYMYYCAVQLPLIGIEDCHCSLSSFQCYRLTTQPDDVNGLYKAVCKQTAAVTCVIDGKLQLKHASCPNPQLCTEGWDTEPYSIVYLLLKGMHYKWG